MPQRHPSSAFFIGVDSLRDSVSSSQNDDADRGLQRMLTVGAQSDYHLDWVGGKFASLRIALRPGRLAVYVVSTAVFVALFTAVSYDGIVVRRLTTKIGVVDNHVDKQVELFNTFSGFGLAMVEVLLDLWMHNFLPGLLVYLHNALWFLHPSKTVKKAANVLRSVLIVLFPVLLMLLIGNSLRSLQASQTTVGFEYVMTSDDLRRERPLIEVVKEQVGKADPANTTTIGNGSVTTIPLGILENAVKGSSIPFEIDLEAMCSTGAQSEAVDRLSLHDLDATNVIYGFTAREWNTEALSDGIKFNVTNQYSSSNASSLLTPPSAFSFKLAVNMFLQGKIMLDRGIAASVNDYRSCEEDMPDKRCAGMQSTLVNAGNALANKTNQTTKALMDLVSNSFGDLIEGFNRSDVTVTLQHHIMSPQLRLDVMTVEGYSSVVTENSGLGANTTSTKVYKFGNTTQEYCSALDCVLVDHAATARVPHQIVALPSHTNCSLGKTSLEYSKDLRMFYPKECSVETNAFVAVSTMTYISGDECGSSLSATDDTPYIINPRRSVRVVIVRYTWTTQDLATSFSALCKRKDPTRSCKGLAFQLARTKRYVFASEDALPTTRIARTSFASPHRLVQLNPALPYISSTDQTVVPELLSKRDGSFRSVKWSSQGLRGTNCSQLISSYIRHVERNSYLFDRSPAAVYRASLFFLLGQGSVTDLRDPSMLMTNRHRVEQLAAQDSLELLRLKGDVQLREVRVSVPLNSYVASLVGCGGLVLVAILVAVVPSRRLEFFPMGTSHAAKYIAVRNPRRYPDALYRKTLLFPATHEALPIHEFAIDEITLSHKRFPEDQLVL